MLELVYTFYCRVTIERASSVEVQAYSRSLTDLLPFVVTGHSLVTAPW